MSHIKPHLWITRGLINRLDYSIDNQNFKYQDMQYMYLRKVTQDKIFEAKCQKDLVNVPF